MQNLELFWRNLRQN